MKVSDILTRSRDILQDADADYWSEAELPRWLSDGRLEAYKLRPDLYEVTEVATLAEGFRQELPNKSRRLLSVTRNVSAPKQRAITVIQADVLARIRPQWRSAKPAAEILHYMYSELDPGHYDVYPPARADVQIEISYAKLPAAVSNPDTELSEEGEYATALIDYVLYRAFLKEADTVPAFHDRAMLHLQMARATLVGDVAVKADTSPNRKES